jgi:SET domain-containing protein
MKRRRKTPFKVPTKVEVRYSPGKGRGVFATKRIRRGEVIEAAPSLVVPSGDTKRIETSFLKHYIFQTDSGFDYVVATGYVAIANHDDDNNAEFFVSREVSSVRAVKTILPGEEVTVDYGWTENEWPAAVRKVSTTKTTKTRRRP